MSAAEVEADRGEAPAERAPSTQGPGRVLGVFLTLALFLGGLFWIGQGLLVRPVDGAEKQREYFGAGAPPLGLALERAVRLPGGDVLVRFARPAGAAAAAPEDAVFLELESRSAVEALLRPTPEEMPGAAAARLKEWEEAKAFEWHTTRQRGDFHWGAWSSKLLIERSYAQGGGWREEARVDLSSRGRNLVLLAHWPAETPVDEGVLRELLAAVVLEPAG